MLLRIYESGGACPDTLDAISTRTRLNKRVVSGALDELFRETRLVRESDGIANPKATKVIAESRELFKKRKIASQKAGFASAEKRKEKQGNVATSRSTDEPQTSTHLHLQEQDSLFSTENRVPDSGSRTSATKPERRQAAASPVSDWPVDFRDQFWDAFPRKTEKKSAMAKLEVIKKSGAVPWARFIAGVHRYCDHVAGTEERYIKHPTTWLNRGCWDDEHPERKQPSRDDRTHSNAGPAPTRDATFIAAMGRTLERRRAARAADDAGSNVIREDGNFSSSCESDADGGAACSDDGTCRQLTLVPTTNR
jgi:uncharacterized protein YdaU (DUF1376 family)